jgi:hypothetical protein
VNWIKGVLTSMISTVVVLHLVVFFASVTGV